MKKNIKKRNILRNICILLILIYIAYILINQQTTLNKYTDTSESLNLEIKEEIALKEELQSQKDNVESLDFIEEMAREKLDMYYPNEKIYVDNGK